jgi:hypothetical protein
MHNLDIGSDALRRSSYDTLLVCLQVITYYNCSVLIDTNVNDKNHRQSMLYKK